MAGPLPLRSDFDADMLRREARRSRDAAQARRLLALATIYDGGSRGDAARVGGGTLQIVRDRGEGRLGTPPAAGSSRERAEPRESGSTRRAQQG
jgi:hypothetical protein